MSRGVSVYSVSSIFQPNHCLPNVSCFRSQPPSSSPSVSSPHLKLPLHYCLPASISLTSIQPLPRLRFIVPTASLHLISNPFPDAFFSFFSIPQSDGPFSIVTCTPKNSSLSQQHLLISSPTCPPRYPVPASLS